MSREAKVSQLVALFTELLQDRGVAFPFQPAQSDPRMTLHISIRRKPGSLNASTSSLNVPKVLSGRCFMPW